MNKSLNGSSLSFSHSRRTERRAHLSCGTDPHKIPRLSRYFHRRENPALLLSVAGGSAVADKSYAKAAVIFVCGAAVSAAGLKIYSSLTKRLSRHTEEKGGDGLSESEQKTSETRKTLESRQYPLC